MNIKAFLLKLLAQKKYRDKFKPETFKKILIVRPAKIGDTICMIPLIRELKKAFPSARIDIYASTYNNFMFKHVPQVDRVYTEYRTKHILKTIIDIFRMRSNKYDLIINTMVIRFSKTIKLIFINATWLIAITGGSSRYGLDNSDLKLYYKVNPWGENHTTDRLLEFLLLLGISNYDNSMEFPVGDTSIKFARSFLKPYTKYKFIGLNADATSHSRTLTDSDIINICRGLKKDKVNVKILLFCTRDRQNHMTQLANNACLVDVLIEQGSKSIFDAAALASFMHVIISPDTSFVHIASAFNIPTVGIFPNDPDLIKSWSPRSKKHVIIKPDEPGNTIRGFSIEKTVSSAIQLLT